MINESFGGRGRDWGSNQRVATKIPMQKTSWIGFSSGSLSSRTYLVVVIDVVFQSRVTIRLKRDHNIERGGIR